jgi:hypothetical protein
MFNENNQIHNFISSSGSGTVISYGSGSDFLTSYGSGSTSQKVTVPVPVPQHCSLNCLKLVSSFGVKKGASVWRGPTLPGYLEVSTQALPRGTVGVPLRLLAPPHLYL